MSPPTEALSFDGPRLSVCPVYLTQVENGRA